MHFIDFHLPSEWATDVIQQSGTTNDFVFNVTKQLELTTQVVDKLKTVAYFEFFLEGR